MTTIVIDDKKRGAQEMLDLLRALDFVTSSEITSKSDSVKARRLKLIKYPNIYDPLALAGAAENSPVNLAQIRKQWTKVMVWICRIP
jgi:hypothetical protein